MSRPAHLPPRCPLQSRGFLPCETINEDNELGARHHRSPSQSSILDDQPSWLDDLLTDLENSPKGTSLRRSSSDSAALLEVSRTLHFPIFPVDEENTVSDDVVQRIPEPIEVKETCTSFEVGSGFGASCIYGPNSPRQKSTLTDAESSMVNALLENAPPSPFQYLVLDFPNNYRCGESKAKEEVQVAAGVPEPEKALRRRSGQRSRVRKLQYIAELERTVDALQALGAELAAGVASLLQQRVTLSVENKKLRRQIASLCQEKIIKDGQYQSLKNEVGRLKMVHGRHRRSKSAASCFEMGPLGADPSGINWQMLDLRKLSLGGSSVPLNYSFGP